MHRMRKIVYLVIIIAMLGPVLTACWSRKELNELSIVSAMGIDYAEGKFVVSFQIINPQEVSASSTPSSGSGETSISIYQETAPTLIEVIHKISTKVPRRIYLSHLQLMVLGETLGERGVQEIIDAISREEKFRPDFYVFSSKEKSAFDILLMLTPLDRIPANFINGAIEAAEKLWGAEQSVSAFEMVQLLQEPGKELVIPGITVKGDVKQGSSMANLQSTESPAYLEIEGFAVYQKGKLKGWLDEKQSRGFNFTRPETKIKGTMVLLQCSELGYVSMDVFDIKPKTKVKIIQGKPHVTFSVNVTANIAETSCHELDLEQQATISKLLAQTESVIKDMIESSVKQAKEWNTDIFGIESILRKKKPKFWREFEKKGQDVIQAMDYNVVVDAKLRHTGRFVNSVLKGWEE